MLLLRIGGGPLLFVVVNPATQRCKLDQAAGATPHLPEASLRAVPRLRQACPEQHLGLQELSRMNKSWDGSSDGSLIGWMRLDQGLSAAIMEGSQETYVTNRQAQYSSTETIGL